eukprot:Gb_35482 [translate_table: standard]
MAFYAEIRLNVALALFCLCIFGSDALISPQLGERIQNINDLGPHLGLVIPTLQEMLPFIQPPTFTPAPFPPIDIAGRRFHVGFIKGRVMVVAMSGRGMINAAVTTQLLLCHFKVRGIIHYGTAGNGNPSLHIGDITIPRQWAHTGMLNWERFQSDTDTDESYGYLDIAKYYVPSREGVQNLLYRISYQPDEIFRIDGTPEVPEKEFWVSVDDSYYTLAGKIEEKVELASCVNSTACLSHRPKIVRVERGCSANVYVDNSAYRDFLHKTFKITPIDMETAGVCRSQGRPFIAMRSLADLAGGSNEANEASISTELSFPNSVTAVTGFIDMVPTPRLGSFTYDI